MESQNRCEKCGGCDCHVEGCPNEEWLKDIKPAEPLTVDEIISRVYDRRMMIDQSGSAMIVVALILFLVLCGAIVAYLNVNGGIGITGDQVLTTLKNISH